MLKKTITYVDYDGLERTEDFRFNLTEAEALEWEMSVEGGLTSLIQKITSEKNNVELMKLFKQMITKTYGVKSDDGRFFDKSEEISRRFCQSPAYNILMMELVQDAEKAAAFFNAVIPSVPNPPPSKS